MKDKNISSLREINSNYLNAGIRFWLKVKSKWANDFHNDLYKYLNQLQTSGFTETWWKGVLDVLAVWVALRPRTKKFIFERGDARLSDLSHEYRLLLRRSKGNIPSNMLIEWKDAEPLFEVAKEIKAVSSPVFASKLCHFIAPGVFPVIDQEVLGGSNNYQNYWQFCKEQWQKTKDKDLLIRILSNKIGKEVIPEYPWSTKIVELCLIGERITTQT